MGRPEDQSCLTPTGIEEIRSADASDRHATRVIRCDRRRRHPNRARIEGPLRIAWRRFRRHRPGLAGLAVLALLYLLVVFADLIAPYGFDSEERDLYWAAPNICFSDANGFSLRPFVHPLRIYTNLTTFENVRDEDLSQRLYLRFFVQA